MAAEGDQVSAGRHGVDEEINLDQLKVLKAIFEVSWLAGGRHASTRHPRDVTGPLGVVQLKATASACMHAASHVASAPYCRLRSNTRF